MLKRLVLALMAVGVGVLVWTLFSTYDKDLGNVQVSVIVGSISEDTISGGKMIIKPACSIQYDMRQIDRIYADSTKGLVVGKPYELTLNIRSNGFAPIAHLLDYREISK